MRAGKHGRVASVWRQLFAFGQAVSNETSQRLIEGKWLPTPFFLAQLRGTYLAPPDAKDLFADDRLLRISKGLASGSSADALGWSHEAWRATLQMPHGKRLIRELLTLYACGELGHENWDTKERTWLTLLCSSLSTRTLGLMQFDLSLLTASSGKASLAQPAATIAVR